jgi:hypothetical protein
MIGPQENKNEACIFLQRLPSVTQSLIKLVMSSAKAGNSSSPTVGEQMYSPSPIDHCLIPLFIKQGPDSLS